MSISPIVFSSLPTKTVLGEVESYYTAVNPTPGTGLATIAAATTLSDTAPFVAIHAGATKSVYLDYIKLIVTAAGTGGSAIRYAAKVDQGKAAPAGGTQLTPRNAVQRGDTTTPPAAGASVYAGPLTAAAAVAPLLLSHGMIRPVIPVVGDTYLFDFGPEDQYLSTGLLPSGTAIADRFFCMPPVILRPSNGAAAPNGSTFHFHVWLPSQSAASSYEVEVGFWEF